MGTNYNQIDWFTNFTVVIAAGESRKISKLGKYITILSNSGADPRIQINGQNGGIVSSGLSIELPPSENFDKLEFVNESGASITMQIAISNGKIIDSRTVLSGSVGVKADPLNTPLPTVDTQIASLITAINNQKDYVTIGANKLSVYNIGGVSTLLTPAANTTGIIIRTCDAYQVGAPYNVARVFADTSAPSSYSDVTKRCILNQIGYPNGVQLQNYKIPSGNGLYLAVLSQGFIDITYDTI